MMAAHAMRIAEAARIVITIEGDNLVLAAPAKPPASVIDLLARNKSAILNFLRRTNGGLSRSDWQELFDERAGIAEFEGGLLREQAEVQAFSCCVDEWLDRNPVRSPTGCCVYCGQSLSRLGEYIWANSARDPSEVWLHHECSVVWHRDRKQKAVEALTALFARDIETTLN